MPDREGRRVLIAFPYGRDAGVIADLLRRRDCIVVDCVDPAGIAARIDDEAGVVLLAEEALVGDLSPLERVLGAQPVWSDLPFILLAGRTGPDAPVRDGARRRLPATATNVVMLERPLGAESLLSAVEAALRSRHRQLEMRDRLEEIAAAAATLEEKVAARTRELQAELAHRQRVEATLRQSQKMEAIGHLTGGIAHDFNNMLTGVMGSLDIMRRRLAAGRLDGLERFMDAASASAQRAATLTQRLLAFSRRQSLDPRPVDIDALVAGLRELLERSVHERIALRLVASHTPAHALVDANQLESAILNLVINARDAMPEGGELTIETGRVQVDASRAEIMSGLQPGAYVMVAVSDTGVGMTPELLDKVFDPFFTTKPVGQGTGLGLSMVYGFAQQSGGGVRIHSQPGQGTSVKMYLPASARSPAGEQAEAAPTQDGDGQTVLLVEDDDSVRLLVSSVLQELGYEAVEVGDPRHALPILKSRRAIDLMISDVGLPGMNGRQLAEIARQHRPDLPILFITGYAENAAIRAGFLGQNMAMIGKPFNLEALAAKIAGMLPAGQ